MITGLKRANQVAFVVAGLALVGAFVYLQIIRSVEPLALDQGLFACFGRWVPRGLLPYRDLFDSKPPLFLYTWVAAWSFGGSAASVWWFEAVWLALTMGLAYALAARLWGRWAGLAAAAFLFLGLWSPGFGGYWSRAQAEEFMALPMLGAGWLALSSLDRERLALWAGVLTGVVGLYKIPGMSVGGAWLALWWLRLPPRPAARRTVWMAAGLAAPWLVAIAWFAAHGALGDFYRGAFVYHRHNAEYISPPWRWVLGELARFLWRDLAGTIVCAAAGLVLLWRRDRARLAWLGPWVALTLAAVVLQRQLAGYQVLLVVPGLSLTAAYGVTALAREAATRGAEPLRRASCATLLAVAVIAGVARAPAWQREYGRDAAHLTGRLSRRDYLKTYEKGLFSPAVEEEAAAYLRARTGPNDRILVWGLSPGIYALADRRPATRYPFHKVLLTDAPFSRAIPGLEERRAAFLASLEADPPAYILLGTRDRNPFEPDDSVSGMLKFARFATFVQGRYQEMTTIGRFVVLRRQPAAAPPAP